MHATKAMNQASQSTTSVSDPFGSHYVRRLFPSTTIGERFLTLLERTINKTRKPSIFGSGAFPILQDFLKTPQKTDIL